MSPTDLIGTRVMEYDVMRIIGTGGMGMVYEGAHPVIGKRVAIKVLLPQFAEDASLLKRFVDEARAVNAIRHRGIIDIFGFGRLQAGGQYICMELLEGSSFASILMQRRRLPWWELVPLADQVLDALAAAHDAGVIHRDIKPSNLFLVNTGRGEPYVKVLDFGIAKLLGTGEQRSARTAVVGTPEYMSPEQILAQPIGSFTDIYGLSVVMYEMLTGHKPFMGGMAQDVMRRHVTAPRPPPSSAGVEVPRILDALVVKMMAAKADERPTIAEARAVLSRLKDATPPLGSAAVEGPLSVVTLPAAPAAAPVNPGDIPTPRHDPSTPKLDEVTHVDRAPPSLSPSSGTTALPPRMAQTVDQPEVTARRDPNLIAATLSVDDDPPPERVRVTAEMTSPGARPVGSGLGGAGPSLKWVLGVVGLLGAGLIVVSAMVANFEGNQNQPMADAGLGLPISPLNAVDSGSAALPLADAEADAGETLAEPDGGEAASESLTPVPPPPPPSAVDAGETPRPKPDPLSAERLLSRAARVEARLSQKEKAAGRPDVVNRSILDSVRHLLAGQPDAKQRKSAAQILNDLELQLK